MVRKIVSGGQTGVDRAALDFAIRRGIPHGGYCPKGRRSESGRIAAKYRLTECASTDYAMRTALNVMHSNGTLILTRGRPEGGTQRTIELCIEYGKPNFIIDLDRKLQPANFAAWLREHLIETLNVAGPRESKQSGIAKQTRKVLQELFPALD
jgi:predicted Rossmann-fold nucleotide-binding protein